MATKTKTKARVRDLKPKKQVKGGGMVKSSDPDGPPRPDRLAQNHNEVFVR
jgi:hypothetical protein